MPTSASLKDVTKAPKVGELHDLRIPGMGTDLLAKGGLCWKILQHLKLGPIFQFSFLVGVAAAVPAGHGRTASFDVFVIEKNNQRAGEELPMKCRQYGLQALPGNVRPPESGEARSEVAIHV